MNDPAAFQFAIVSDRTGGERPGVFAKAVEKLNLLQPEFVMCVGDLIEGYTEDEAILNRQWDEFGSIAGQLEMPFFHVPGNHDISNPVMAKKWEERFGKVPYSFVYRDVLFLCLNSCDTKQHHITEQQAGWVRETLARHEDARWTLIFLHTPLWNDPPSRGWPAIEEALGDRPCTVFAGHHHTYTKETRNGRRYFVLATTGGGSSLRGPLFGEFDHAVWVTMTENGPKLANLMLDGIRDENIRTAEQARIAGWLLESGRHLLTPVMRKPEQFRETASTFTLANPLEVPIRFDSVIEKLAPDCAVEPAGLEKEITPGQEETITFQIRFRKELPAGDILPAKLNWTVTAAPPGQPRVVLKGSEPLAVIQPLPCARPQTAVTVDGKLDEWGELPYKVREPAQVLKNAAAWQGPEDCRFKFGIVYDEHFIHIAVEVKDEEIISAPNTYAWSQDGIELRVDARPEAERVLSRGRGEMRQFHLWALCPNETPDEPWIYEPKSLPKGSHYVCLRKKDGYAAEIAIPAGYFNEKAGREWEGFRLNLAVNDLDADGQAQIWWRPDWRSPQAYPGSGEFRRR